MNVSLTANGQQLLDRLRAFPELLAVAVARGTSAGVQVALGKTQKERFTGRGPFPINENRIGIRTGRMRNSLLLSSMSRDAQGIGARVVSTGVKYFAPHEFGFAGTVNVKEHEKRQVHDHKNDQHRAGASAESEHPRAANVAHGSRGTFACGAE
jgi:hypothetical protein